MSPMMTHQQQAAVDNRGGELLVSAAAGSGKTRILVERLLDRVEKEGLNLDEFLVITFTRAAASELRGKIMDALNVRLAQQPENRHLRHQKLVVYRAQISTIHAFCSVLLKEEGYHLGLPADLRMADENECNVLKRAVLSRLLEERYDQIDQGDFAALVEQLSNAQKDQNLSNAILDIHEKVQSHAQPEQWLEDQADAFAVEGVKDAGQTIWGRLLMEEARQQVTYWYRRFTEILNLMQGDSMESTCAEHFCSVMDEMDAFLSALDRGWDSARALCWLTFPTWRNPKKTENPSLLNHVRSVRDTCKKRLVNTHSSPGRLPKIFDRSSAELLEDLRAVHPAMRELLRLVLEFSRRYDAEKQRRGLVDFSDLEHLALKLLELDEVRVRWGTRYAEVMVDEYQDTNAVQNAIFNAVSGNGRRLFQVGDVKQSIYRFRLADPTIFLHKYDRFAEAAQAEEGAPRRLVLSYNFRSRKSVMSAVNFIFENIMSRSFGELDYTDDQRLDPRLPYPEQPLDRTEFNLLDMAQLQADGEDSVSRKACEAEFVARRVRQLLDEGHPITDGEGFRPVKPEDIVILYRATTSNLGYLGAALNRWRIPWSRSGSNDFLTADEIVTAIAFLEIVDNPRQDVPLLTVLTSPVYGFTGSELALMRGKHPSGDLYACVKAAAMRGEEKYLAFYNQLNALRSRSADCAGHDLLWSIYEDTGQMTVYGASEGGPLRQENLRLLHEYAVSFGRNDHQSVFTLVNHLRQLRTSGKKFKIDEGGSTGGVQIMSIHKSKGLEFPVVILAGLNNALNTQDEKKQVLFHPALGVGPRFLDTRLRIQSNTLARMAVDQKLNQELKAEELRLLYVAMTRAREKLIMVATFKDWLKTEKDLSVNARLIPDPQTLNSVSTVAEWMLLPMLMRADAKQLRCVGQYNGSPYTVNAPEERWDIRLFPAPMPDSKSENRESTSEVSEKEIHLTDAEIQRLCWVNPHARLADTPSKATATQLKGRAMDEEASEYTLTPLTDFRFEKPRFAQTARGLPANQIGTATHTVMQLIDLKHAANETEVQEEIARLEAAEILTAQEAQAVNPGHVAAFFASPIGQEAAAAADLKREFKFSLLESAARLDPTLPEEEQVLLQGVIDCCFTGSAGLTVVDFKTDRVKEADAPDHAQRYRTQLDVYTGALGRITGKPVTRRVLWFLALGRGIEL